MLQEGSNRLLRRGSPAQPLTSHHNLPDACLLRHSESQAVLSLAHAPSGLPELQTQGWGKERNVLQQLGGRHGAWQPSLDWRVTVGEARGEGTPGSW